MSELPPGWESARLSDLGVEVRGSVKPEPGTTYELFSVPTYPTGRPELLGGEEIGSTKRPVEPDDVLLCKINPRINRVWVVAEPSGGAPQIASTEYLVFRTRDPRLSAYLRWYFHGPSFRRWIELSVEGATGSHTRAKSGPIMEQRMPIPPESEQERIVAAIEEHLCRLDAAESALASARSRLASFRSSTTSDALRGDWPVVRLGDHTVGQRYGSSAKAGREGDVPVLRMGNVVDGHLDFGDLKYLPNGHPDLETCTLAPGDLLFNRTNSPELVGKSAVFEGQATPVTFASYLIRVRVDQQLDPRWVVTAINSPAGRRYIDTVRTQQVGQANVNGTKLKDFPIPMPSIDVQRERLTQLYRARDWLREVDSEINRALTRASTLRRSVLAAAFSGKLVPQDPGEEPASVLLERIRDRAAPTPTRGTRAQASR
jgi:type I restriction enzyme S subunit